MLKWLRFDMAFNVALLEVRFGFEVPKIRNNEEQLIYHTELIYTFRCLPVGCAFFPSFFSNCKLQSSKKHFVKMQFASLCAPFPGCWIFLNQHRLTCALFGTAVWIPWLFKHRLWIGMKWVWRTLPLLPTSCVWPPDNHRPPSHLHPPHRGAFGGNIEGSCWGSQTTGGEGDSLYRQSVENLRTMDEPFSHGISL